MPRRPDWNAHRVQNGLASVDPFGDVVLVRSGVRDVAGVNRSQQAQQDDEEKHRAEEQGSPVAPQSDPGELVRSYPRTQLLALGEQLRGELAGDLGAGGCHAR